MWDMDTCCGFAAAALSILAFGSFAVPIKCQAARRVSVDPLGTTTHGDNARNMMDQESSRPPSSAFLSLQSCNPTRLAFAFSLAGSSCS
jgi:hypothetical protein